jgi:hypothetical protein
MFSCSLQACAGADVSGTYMPQLQNMLVYEWTVCVNGGRGVAAASGADHVDELQLFYGASNLPVVIPTGSTSICYWRWLRI